MKKYAVTLRFPVQRTFPSEVDIPGKLYLNVSAFSDRPVANGERVWLEEVNGQGEVTQCNETSRAPKTFNYKVLHA